MLHDMEEGGGLASGVGCNREKMPPPPLRFSSYSLLEGGDDADGTLGLPTGALFSPFAEMHPSPPCIPRQPVLCTFCSAYPNPFCRVDEGTGGWRCSFCVRDNPCYAEDYIGSSPSEHSASFPEMMYKIVEYSETDLQMASATATGTATTATGNGSPAEGIDLPGVMSVLNLATGQHRRRDRASFAPSHVFVVDGNMKEEALAELAVSVDAVLGGMEPSTLVALVVFTGVVSVYRLGRAGTAVADVFPGGETLAEKEVDARLAKGGKDHFLPAAAGRDALCTVLRLLRGVADSSGWRRKQQQQQQQQAGQENGNSKVSTSNGGGGGGGGSGRQRRSWGARRAPVPPHRRRRCLGAAVEYALRLVRTVDCPSSRLLVCLGGCPNFGPGAVIPCIPGAASAEVEPEALAAATDYFEDVGERALQQGTGVDLFCGGSEALGAAALHGLVAATGGYVLIQQSFGAEFASNLSKSIREQAMSHGDGLHGCVIDIRASSGVELAHVIGPAELTEEYAEVDKEAQKASRAAASTAEVSAPGSSFHHQQQQQQQQQQRQRQGRNPPASNGEGGHGNSNSYNNGNNTPASAHQRLLAGRVDPRASLALYFDGPPKKSEKQKKAAVAAAAALRKEDRGSGVVRDDSKEEHVVFQFVTRRSSPGGDGRITRVVTHRLPVTANDDGFLQSVDPEAIAILIGKEAVLRATFGTVNGTNQLEVEEAREAVDTVVQELSSRFRELRQERKKQTAGSKNNNRKAVTTMGGLLSSANTNSNSSDNGSGSGGGGGNDKRDAQQQRQQQQQQQQLGQQGAVRSYNNSSNKNTNYDKYSSADPALLVERGEAGGFPTSDASPFRPGGGGGRNPARGGEAVGLGGREEGGQGEEEEEEGRGGGGGYDDGGPEGMVFPRELGHLPRQLFHLRRGPLLGPLLQNSDDPLCLRHLFLRGAVEDCLRMMVPAMFSLKAAKALASSPTAEYTTSNSNDNDNDNDDEVKRNTKHTAQGTTAGRAMTAVVNAASLLPLIPVPVETLAMLDDRILVLDTHDRVFVWSGAAVCGPEFDSVRKACEVVFSAEGYARYPSAPVVLLKDGTSWSRYLTSRLIPSHKDHVEDQLKGFPELLGIPEEELERMRAKLPVTDDESYREFFWDVCEGS